MLDNFILLFGMPGPMELIIILIIVLLFVGPKKLPDLMKSVGKSIKSFKSGLKDDDDESKQDDKDDKLSS